MSNSRLQLLGIAVVALVVGFFIGTWRSGVHMETGRADVAGDGGGSITTPGWTYGFTPDVPWTDATNSRHEGDGPDCLPLLSSVDGVRFAWIEVTVEETTIRPVVWINCRGVPPPSEPPAASLAFRTADPPSPEPSDLACVGVGFSDATVHGVQEGGEVLVWLESRGTQVAAVWPNGFTARLDPHLQVVGTDGVVVAEEGDVLELGGAYDPVYSNLFVIHDINGVGYPCW